MRKRVFVWVSLFDARAPIEVIEKFEEQEKKQDAQHYQFHLSRIWFERIVSELDSAVKTSSFYLKMVSFQWQ